MADEPIAGIGPDAAAPEQAKLTHAAVHYGMAKANGERCDACAHYQGKDDCDLVVAPIYPGGWCDRFEARGADAGDPMDDPAMAAAPAPEAPKGPDPLAHGRAIAGAIALHAVGHISPKERDKHVSASKSALVKAGKTAARKPFGAFAP